MNEGLETQNCSAVIFRREDLTQEEEFGVKELKIQRKIDIESIDIPNEPLTSEYFDYLNEERVRLGAIKKSKDGQRIYITNHDTKRRDQVNKKWDAVVLALKTQDKLNYREISRRTRCSFQTIKELEMRIRITGRVPRYEYNNIHQRETVADLQSTIDQLKDEFYSARQIKGRHPIFSLKRIRAEIKDKKFRWRKMPVVSRRKTRYYPPQDDELVEMARKITFVMMQEDSELLYCDEMKLPLIQTPQRFWTKGDCTDERIFNGRSEQVQITAIVLCSKKKFISVQFFLGEVNSASFVYFLQESINHLPNDRRYRILADNAKWHTSNLVKESDSFRFLLFNLPRQFQLNLIENSFSQIRYRFRCRKTYTSIYQELEAMVDLFFDPENEKKFEGYYRNHIRNIDKHLHLE